MIRLCRPRMLCMDVVGPRPRQLPAVEIHILQGDRPGHLAVPGLRDRERRAVEAKGASLHRVNAR